MPNTILEYDKRISKLARRNEDMAQKLRMIDRIVDNFNLRDRDNLRESQAAIRDLVARALENEE